MASEKRTGMTIPAGILQPTTPHEDPATAEGGQGGDPGSSASEPKPPRVRRKKAAPASANEKVEGRRLYLSEDVHFRLKLLAYQRGQKISEVAQEVLDRGLPRYDVNRVG
jgi:hypothetical protein